MSHAFRPASYLVPLGTTGNTYHFPSLFPSISLSLGILGCIDPRRGCPSFYGKKGLKAQKGWCWVKDKSLI
jgi:hypothetical protein